MIFGIVIWPQAISPSQKVAMETSSMSRAKILADSLADAINSVYSAGPGSCRTFLFTLEQGCMVFLGKPDYRERGIEGGEGRERRELHCPD
jgi:hypothetical protein